MMVTMQSYILCVLLFPDVNDRMGIFTGIGLVVALKNTMKREIYGAAFLAPALRLPSPYRSAAGLDDFA